MPPCVPWAGVSPSHANSSAIARIAKAAATACGLMVRGSSIGRGRRCGGADRCGRSLDEMPTVDANYVRLAVVDWGGTGPSALLLHGLARHAREWADTAA
jgi:hypothetical protein